MSPATFSLPVMKAACGLEDPSIIACIVSVSVVTVQVASLSSDVISPFTPSIKTTISSATNLTEPPKTLRSFLQLFL